MVEKMGSRTRTVWTKTKLVLGHAAAGKNRTTEGLGATKPLPVVDAAGESNKQNHSVF